LEDRTQYPRVVGDVARNLAKTEAYPQSRNDRKKVEMLLAYRKRIPNFARLRLRGLSGARGQFLRAAVARNLRRTAKWLLPIAGSGGYPLLEVRERR